METVKEIRFDNCIVRIHEPIMTEEQKQQQEKRIYDATEMFLREVEKERRRLK